ncbi:3-oxoadipate enol-lactonase [Streptomyces venezuelae]|uniref:bifunctional 3-oxoadipate enol-lactonase/4-carboxymuconolactone decarboxylase PcaDC n=1 Tax=Streptomyces gardneri TaxID=66892 RepID=UPI0006BD8322|nr:3-oxoadipate enol-lactonase [Streptomyces gardneri]ALO12998.1 3-oxoadipate enol-lactonase [Streptomyces venezuelae]QPK49682.1 3-oxoadipate enol-lactonase [Streptomyces gardneri]WRK41236.1 3-oxoadipate enol-lactonase [Streptomyces venezuelae]CUM36336.1 Beta-ketoadipate enol-lactone hydrolase [Streptomyces venezuelae]
MTTLLHHRIDGPAHAPVLILGPSLGTSLAVWDAQVPALARRHRVVRYDLPGHGGTPARTAADTAPGATRVADLAALVLALADHLGAERFAYAGISLGGAVGAHLAVHHPERVTRLALVCSSARFGEPAGWHERAALVREKGTDAVAPGALGRWFTPDFAGTHTADRLLDDLCAADAEGYAACCDALAAYDLRAALPRIAAPTLVLAGRADTATPPAHARELADGIPDASLLELAGAAHLAPAERPEAVLSALLGHFGAPDSDSDSDDNQYAKGMAVRRAVLGDAHVDRAVARTTDFTADFQDYITRCAWGEIWTRPGLDRRTRSCLTLTALIAHGHQEELAMHVRAAIRNGLTPEDIKEVLLHSAVYCGVPAANSAFATAQRVLTEDGTPLTL